MALSNIAGWNNNEVNMRSSACGSSCGADKKAACGSSCGASEGTDKKTAACGSSCGASSN